MKIISIHVNNFGKLHNKDFSFADGINSVCEENGWGKSTLSSFIKVMLYGLDGDRVRDELTNERKRYAPWQGGAFGGSMTFEVNAKRYTVTRVFHDKLADDEFELRDATTNLISNDYSEHLGEELFSINAESFMKTVFIRQNEVKSAGTTGDINAKLGNISDGIDLNKYADADSALKDTINSLSPSRKTGLVNKLKSQVSQIKADILATNDLESALKTLDERIDATNVQIDECNEKAKALNETRSKVSKLSGKRANRQKYEELVSEVNKKSDDVSMLKGEVGDAIPDKSLLEEWKRALDTIDRNKAVISANTLSDTEKSIYTDLVSMFSNKLPDDSELTMLIDDSVRLQTLRQNVGCMTLTYDEQVRFDRLGMFYSPDEDVVSAVNEMNAKWQVRTKLIADYSNTMYDLDKLEKEKPSDKRTKIGFAASVIACVSFFIVAIIGGIFLHPLYFASLFASVLFIALGFIFKKQGRTELKSYLDSKSALTKQASDLDHEAIAIENEMADFLQKHGRAYDENSIIRILSDMLIEVSDYLSLYKKHEAMAGSNSIEKCSELTKKISNYLNDFNINVTDEQLQSALVDLRAKSKHYLSLKTSVDNYSNACRICESLTADLKASMRECGIEPGLDIASKLNDISHSIEKISVANRIYEDALMRKEAFEKEVDVVALLTEEEGDLNSITLEELDEEFKHIEEARETYRNSLTIDNRQRDNLLEQYEARQELIEQLESLEEEIKEKTKAYKQLSLTQEYLSKAKESLTARYMEPLLSGFNKYYKVLTDKDADDFRIDANTKITIEAEGKQRDTGMLSLGYQDLTGLCMRLAMADAMYPAEKPVLILDDPFVNLDDGKLKGGKNLLDAVSKDYQVLYFTCSKSRL